MSETIATTHVHLQAVESEKDLQKWDPKDEATFQMLEKMFTQKRQ